LANKEEWPTKKNGQQRRITHKEEELDCLFNITKIYDVVNL
jgi:hypothetical protein